MSKPKVTWILWSAFIFLPSILQNYQLGRCSLHPEFGPLENYQKVFGIYSVYTQRFIFSHRWKKNQKRIFSLGKARLPHYKNILDLSGRHHIRFRVKAGAEAFLFLSGKPVDTVIPNVDIDYCEVTIGGFSGIRSLLKVGTMLDVNVDNVLVDTPGILDGSWKRFWISWFNNSLVVCHSAIYQFRCRNSK